MSVTTEQAASFLKQHIDVIGHIDVDSEHKESLKEVIDTDGKQATLFSALKMPAVQRHQHGLHKQPEKDTK